MLGIWFEHILISFVILHTRSACQLSNVHAEFLVRTQLACTGHACQGPYRQLTPRGRGGLQSVTLCTHLIFDKSHLSPRDPALVGGDQYLAPVMIT